MIQQSRDRCSFALESPNSLGHRFLSPLWSCDIDTLSWICITRLQQCNWIVEPARAYDSPRSMQRADERNARARRSFSSVGSFGFLLLFPSSSPRGRRRSCYWDCPTISRSVVGIESERLYQLLNESFSFTKVRKMFNAVFSAPFYHNSRAWAPSKESGPEKNTTKGG